MHNTQKVSVFFNSNLFSTKNATPHKIAYLTDNSTKDTGCAQWYE